MNRRFDTVVAGAGMIGLTVAALLARSHRGDQFKITIIDAAPRPEFDAGNDVALRVSALSPGSIGILDEAGAWNSIASARVSPYRSMKVWDSEGSPDGPEKLSFDAAEFALGELGFITENILVQAELLRVLEKTEVEIRFETTINAIERDGDRFEVTLSDGGVLRPDLLIGADGARSRIRERAGIDVNVWSHEQKALVTHLRTSAPHRETAWQRFLPDGPIGMLPLADGRISVVWSTTPQAAEDALALSDAELSRLLTGVTDQTLGRLTVDGPRGAFPLNSQHAVNYVLPGLVLIGDAAHSIHPLAGQGANLGLSDAAELASVLTAALEREEYPGDLPVLRRYERSRKGANLTMLRFMDLLNRLFSNDSRTLARVRGIGMYLFNKSGPVRNAAVQHALGVR
jgi:2-octaprenylphenol hydroxylase